MKCIIAIAFIAILATSVVADGSTCKIYSCGSITQTEEGPNTCVQVDDNVETTFNIQNCEGTTPDCVTTEATWLDPATAPATATCGVIANPDTFPPTPVTIAGAGVPGDFCSATADCVKEEGVTCEGTTCTTTLGLNDECTTSTQCPAGHFCSTDVEAKVCTVARKAGETCNTINLCAYDSVCIQIDGSEEMKCAGRSSVEDGVKFTPIAGQPKAVMNLGAGEDVDPKIISYYICKTGYALLADPTSPQLECRNGARNDEQERRTDFADNTCAITKFDGDTKEGVASTTTSRCGFNIVNNAFCQMLKGDDDVIKAIEGVKHKDVDYSKCHPLSGPTTGTCMEVKDKLWTQPEFFKFFQRSMQAILASSPLVADNDQCVANSITQQFWFGKFGDDAMSYSFIGTLSVFAILMAFIY
jgi:hypothetical protein